MPITALFPTFYDISSTLRNRLYSYISSPPDVIFFSLHKFWLPSFKKLVVLWNCFSIEIFNFIFNLIFKISTVSVQFSRKFWKISTDGYFMSIKPRNTLTEDFVTYIVRMEVCINTSNIVQVYRFAPVASGCDTSWF